MKKSEKISNAVKTIGVWLIQTAKLIDILFA